MDKLFVNVTYGTINASNALVMAPMTRCRAKDDGSASEIMSLYYAQRASAGLIITEGIQPSLIGKGFMNTPGLHDKKHVDSWKEVTKKVHEEGGKIFAQLMHVGRIGHPLNYDDGHRLIAPSAIAAKGEIYTPEGLKNFVEPKEMDKQDIKQAILDHVEAAKNAIDAGFDGIEIHCGNGFLIHQFISKNTNLRQDEYGISLSGRLKFALEIIQQCCQAIGSSKVGIRVSPQNQYNDIEEGDSNLIYQNLISELPKDLAYIHIMESNNREMTKIIRELWSGKIILNPHISENHWPASIDSVSNVLEEDIADGISLGALFVANPDLVNRIKSKAKLNKPKEEYYYSGGADGYIDYPILVQ